MHDLGGRQASSLLGRYHQHRKLSTEHAAIESGVSNVSKLQVFGVEAYVFVPKAKRTNLEPKAENMVFIGYSLQHKAWRSIDMKTNKVTFSRDARFLLPTGRKIEATTEGESLFLFPLPTVDLNCDETKKQEELKQANQLTSRSITRTRKRTISTLSTMHWMPLSTKMPNLMVKKCLKNRWSKVKTLNNQQ